MYVTQDGCTRDEVRQFKFDLEGIIIAKCCSVYLFNFTKILKEVIA